MGRPLKKSLFGPPGSGTEIKVRYRATGQSEANGWILKQKSARRFECTDGTNPMVCRLVDKAQGALAVGDMTIVVNDGGTARQVTKISGKTCTLDTGSRIDWDFTGTGDTVEMEEAGTNTSFSGADDFETD